MTPKRFHLSGMKKPQGPARACRNENKRLADSHKKILSADGKSFLTGTGPSASTVQKKKNGNCCRIDSIPEAGASHYAV